MVLEQSIRFGSLRHTGLYIPNKPKTKAAEYKTTIQDYSGPQLLCRSMTMTFIHGLN